jgi:hypothetical protein
VAKRLNVNLDELADAMDQHDEYGMGSKWFLDARDGRVVGVSTECMSAAENEEEGEDDKDSGRPEWQRAEMALARTIAGDTEGRYERIPENETHEAYSLMEDFVGALEDANLQEKLQIAITGKGAFRRFKDVLFRYPEVREQWFEYEKGRKREWAREWLESLDIETTWTEPARKGGSA